MPAYATTAQGGPIDVAPKERKGRRVSAPPGQQVSATEFQEMVKDLGVDDAAAAPDAAARPRPVPPARPVAAAPARAPTAAVTRRRPLRHQGNGGDGAPKERKPRNKRHGRPR